MPSLQQAYNFLHRTELYFVNDSHHLKPIFISNDYTMPLFIHWTRIFILDTYVWGVILDSDDTFWTRLTFSVIINMLSSGEQRLNKNVYKPSKLKCYKGEVQGSTDYRRSNIIKYRRSKLIWGTEKCSLRKSHLTEEWIIIIANT